MTNEQSGCLIVLYIFLIILAISLFAVSKLMGLILLVIIAIPTIVGIVVDKHTRIKQIEEQKVRIALRETAQEKEAKRKREEEEKYFQKLKKLDQLQNLSGSEFESLVAKIFRKMGYKVMITPKTGDEGIDIDTIDPQGEKVVIQCKRWQGTVSSKVVREFYGSLMHAKAEKGFLVTTGTFSTAAIAFAKGKPISLIDGKDFIDTMATLEEPPQQKSTQIEKTQLNQEPETEKEHKLVPTSEKPSQQEYIQEEKKSGSEHEVKEGHKLSKHEAKLRKYKLKETWRDRKISNLRVGWMVWWRAFVPIIVTSIPFRREMGAIWIIVLTLSLFLLNRAGKVVAQNEYNLKVDHFMGWSIWWRTILPIFFIGIISFGLFDTSFAGWLIVFAFYVFSQIVIVGWATNQVIKSLLVSLIN